MARTRAVSRSARARVPKATASITVAGSLEPGVGIVEGAGMGEEAGEGDGMRRHHEQRARAGEAGQPVADDLAQEGAVVEVVLHLHLVR